MCLTSRVVCVMPSFQWLLCLSHTCNESSRRNGARLGVLEVLLLLPAAIDSSSNVIRQSERADPAVVIKTGLN